MEEEKEGNNWLLWLLIVPVCMAAGALAVKLMLGPRGPAATPAAPTAAASSAEPAPFSSAAATPAAAPAETSFDLPGDERQADPSLSWGEPKAQERAPADAQPAAKESSADAKKSRDLGLAYGALTKLADKLLGNPKALSAVFNNDYVVKGFMSRDTVKNATANKASLAAYMKNPKNLSEFMSKSPVQRGLNNSALVSELAASKLASALLDTPGGKALLSDPAAITDIIKTNPELLGVLTNPSVIGALSKNPKTAGVVGAAMSGGR
ncbi:MAG: hypothetical protein HY952_00355 [Elusimicrobia bacterium]|nr:hypothetical protein [Elusimicrobiota bacterium]